MKKSAGKGGYRKVSLPSVTSSKLSNDFIEWPAQRNIPITTQMADKSMSDGVEGVEQGCAGPQKP